MNTPKHCRKFTVTNPPPGSCLSTQSPSLWTWRAESGTLSFGMGRSSCSGQLWGFWGSTRTSCCTWTSSASVSDRLTCGYLSDLTHWVANQLSNAWNNFKWLQSLSRLDLDSSQVTWNSNLSHLEGFALWLWLVLVSNDLGFCMELSSVTYFVLRDMRLHLPVSLAMLDLTWTSHRWLENPLGLVLSEMRLNVDLE